jgi:hypothetical protein
VLVFGSGRALVPAPCRFGFKHDYLAGCCPEGSLDEDEFRAISQAQVAAADTTQAPAKTPIKAARKPPTMTAGA